MHYFGGKFRISKPLSEFLNSQLTDDQIFVDLFCGSLNVATNIESDNLILNDRHYYLIQMWKRALEGWIPPTSVSEEEYQEIKKNPQDYDPALVGFVGFACSFSGKWWGGYCRDNTGRNYAKNGSNSILKKIGKLKDKNIQLFNKNYSEVNIPENSIVYSDIPYKNSTQYSKKEVGSFCHDSFYNWVRKAVRIPKCKIYISEYRNNVPDDFRVVWSHKSKKDIRNKNGIQEATNEVVIEYSTVNTPSF